MMIFVGMIMTTLTACDNKTKQQPIKADNSKQDSIARVKAEEEKVKLAFEDSVAIYAWGDAKFGMSKKEALQTTAFGGAQKYEYGLAMNSDKEYALQRSLHLFSFPSIWAYFGGENYSELTEISIDESIGWEYFNYLTNDLTTMIAMFTNKYGKPDNMFVDLSSLKYTDVDKAKTLSVADWKIGSGKGSNGTKLIEIKIEPCTDTSYEYKIKIRNPAFPKNPKKKTQKEIAEEKEQAKMKREVMENSF